MDNRLVNPKAQSSAHFARAALGRVSPLPASSGAVAQVLISSGVARLQSIPLHGCSWLTPLGRARFDTSPPRMLEPRPIGSPG